jgi:4-hydroxybenzoate polyprenyltransferase
VHPEKRDRPVAAGRVPLSAAWTLAAALMLITAAAGALIGPQFLAALGAFYGINLAYSMWLKNVVLLDVMMIALSFVTRAVAGVMALRPLEPDLEISPWLLVCTLFLALFLGFGKRRHELTLLEKEASGHRATLGEYTPVFLDQLIAIVTAATIIAYAIYTVAPETIAKFQTHQLVATVPFVAYGVFRYLFLIQRRGGGGSPSRALYRDPPLALAVAAWIVAVAMVLYAGGS